MNGITYIIYSWHLNIFHRKQLGQYNMTTNLSVFIELFFLQMTFSCSHVNICKCVSICKFWEEHTIASYIVSFPGTLRLYQIVPIQSHNHLSRHSFSKTPRAQTNKQTFSSVEPHHEAVWSGAVWTNEGIHADHPWVTCRTWCGVTGTFQTVHTMCLKEK